MNVYDAKGKNIPLGETVGRGGEATVFRVRGQTGWLAKIYETGPRSNYSDKLAWMVSHPPENPTRSIAHPSLAWPAGLLFDSKRRLAGYLMPHIHAAVPILDVLNPRRRLMTMPRFDRRYLHRAARNLATTVNALHAREYVIGDLNESNVLVTPSALISVIDTDSFQVQEVHGGKVVVHPCPVGKLEYTAPELHRLAIGKVVRQPEHDAFALGVLLFQLLMEGSHPFRARWLGSGDPPPIETRIAQGIFPYTTIPDSRVHPPKGALEFNHLHPDLVELFIRCFVDGHKDPGQRPIPSHWVQALAQAENSLVQCPNRHLYSDHLAKCPNCKTVASWAGPGATAASRDRKTPKYAYRQQAAASKKTATSRPAVGTPPKAGPTQSQRPYWNSRYAHSIPPIDWRAFIASQLNIPWPQPAYPYGAPSQPSPASPPPSRPNPIPQTPRRPAFQQANLWAWAKPRISKSLLTGGVQGSLIGALIGGLVGMASASLGGTVAWTLMWALGGASAGVLRGWKPGYRLSEWVSRRIGWHRVWPALGLLGGALGGMFFGLVIGWWAIIPVFICLYFGARLGKNAGHRIAELGNRLGWERIWAGLGAVFAALVGWQVAAWLGGGAVGGLAIQSAAALAGWLSGSTPSVLVIALVSGALLGGLGGAVSGSLADLFARFAGLAD